MCGIAGFISFNGHARDAAAARARRMTDAIVHRGPDESGQYIDDFAALGHRRLAIIDLATGQQPMSALDGRVQIVFNGEIYNFLDVRRELEGLGHQFNTHCDTETILRGYVQWGEACVEKLHGMFAFALWDARNRSVLLARDRVGKKPLYYCRQGGTLAFASEIKALRAGEFGDGQLDPQAVDCYFTLGYVPAPRSIFRDVKKLRPAHTLVATAEGGAERRYWSLSFANVRRRSLAQATEEFGTLLDEAVRCRLMSEVPLGAFLSGGLDSSLVVSAMARNLSKPVITNSIGFEDRRVSELDAAAATAQYLRTDHHEFVVQPHASEVLERIAWHFDEPLADSSAVPTWYVCEMARRTVTVALSGDGGDEAFGGYTFRYLPHMVEARVRAALPAAVRSSLFGVAGALWPASARLPKVLRLKTIFENLSVSDAEAFYHDLAWLRPDTRAALYAPGFQQLLAGFTPMETVAPFYSHGGPDALARSQYTDINLYMTDDVLVKMDRMSMAHSLEVRCPLLDHRILEFAATLPAELKIAGGQGKVPLRQLAAQRLPDEVRRRPKQGFAAPTARWLREELKPMAQDVILSRTGVATAWLDRPTVGRLWDQHQSGARDHSVFLWGLMMFELWGRHYAAAA
jgi:asparagine synthase (glutamine-hydrolysing)